MTVQPWRGELSQTSLQECRRRSCRVGTASTSGAQSLCSACPALRRLRMIDRTCGEASSQWRAPRDTSASATGSEGKLASKSGLDGDRRPTQDPCRIRVALWGSGLVGEAPRRMRLASEHGSCEAGDGCLSSSDPRAIERPSALLYWKSGDRRGRNPTLPALPAFRCRGTTINARLWTADERTRYCGTSLLALTVGDAERRA